MKYLFFIPLFFSNLITNAQNNNIIWQKTLGCTNGTNIPWGGIREDNAGNLCISGEYNQQCIYTAPVLGAGDGWILKTDSLGNQIWSIGLGGAQIDAFIKTIATSDGGVVALGYSESNIGTAIVNKGDLDFWIVKLDSTGNLQWQKNYGGSGNDVPSDIIETSDGGYIAIGYTVSKDGDITDTIGGHTDAWLIRLNSEGYLLWQKSYGSTDKDYFNSIVKKPNGNYLVLGSSWGTGHDVPPNNGVCDVWLTEINDSGAIQWSKTYGGSDWDVASTGSVKKAKSGGYIFSCDSKSNDLDFPNNYGGEDIWLVKIDDTGKVEWKKNYGGSQNEGYSSEVINSKENGYMIFSTTSSNDLDAAGNHGSSDIMIIKVDDTGKVIWHNMYGGTAADAFDGAFQKNDSSYMVIGDIMSVSGNIVSPSFAPIWLFRISKDSTYTSTAVAGISRNDDFQVFPTLTDNEIIIQRNSPTDKANLQLTDMYGKLLLQKELQPSELTETISLKQLSSGMYFLKIYSQQKCFSYKVMRR